MGPTMSDFEGIDDKLFEETIQHLKTSTCAIDTLSKVCLPV